MSPVRNLRNRIRTRANRQSKDKQLQNSKRAPGRIDTLVVISYNEAGGNGRRLVLAPFNRVQVDALLDEFPQWTEFPQERDSVFDSFQDVVDFSISGEAANAESDTAVCTLVAVAESPQDITWLKGGRRASTAG
jgi:hypothetical protein